MSPSNADAVLEDFNFRVKWDGKFISGISKVSALVRTTEVVEHREGGSLAVPMKAPGRTSYESITLERGRTFDNAFEAWAALVEGFPPNETESASFRKDVTIDLLDDAGRLVMSFQVFRCWPSRYETLSALDANGTALLVEQLTLENEGWARDLAVVPPAS
jgi:phage tail-like protein